jgi:hypothetical protein
MPKQPTVHLTGVNTATPTDTDSDAKGLSSASDNAADQAPESDDGCICDWPADCGGLGTIFCDGCGGDLCVCVCGGESECFGCAICAYGDDLDDCPDDDDASSSSAEHPA